MKSGSALRVVSNADIEFKASLAFKASGGTTTEVKAGSAMRLDAPVIRINGGNKPIVASGATLKSSGGKGTPATVEGNVAAVLVP